MTKGSTSGPYDLFSASYALSASQISTTKFDVSVGDGLSSPADTFKSTGDLTGTCGPLP